jgi:hypothetical protein
MALRHIANCAVLLAVFLLTLTTAVSAQKARGPLGAMVDQLASLFPKVEGEVIEVQGQVLTVSLGRRDGVRQGLELSIYREGRELRHPRTGELLGKTEQPLGRVSLSQVFEAYSHGSVAQAEKVRPGDKVRVSAGKIPLTLLTLSDGVKAPLTEAVVQELIEELNQTGRFQIFQGDQIGVFLSQNGVKGPEALQGKGIQAATERFKVEQLLVIYLSRAQNKPYMELRLFSWSRPEPALSTALFVPPSIKPPPQGGFSASIGGRQQAPKPKERSLLARLLGGDLEAGTYSSGESSIPLKEVSRLNFPVLAMDLSVSPQDKIPRLVVTDGLRIFLYRVVSQALEVEWTYTSRGFGKILSVQLADLDGDGAFEVVANRYHPQPSIGLNSFILAARGGKVVPVVDNVSQILLAVDADGGGIKKTLWAQRYSSESFFTPGQADRATLRNGSLVHEGPVQVPGSFRATGATMSSISGKGTRSLAYVDEHDRLWIAFGSEETWRSSSPVGGGDHLKIEVIKQESARSQVLFAYMQPIPLSVDLDGDGIEEIVVPQNQAPGHLAVVFRGPTGYRFQSVNSGFEGTITGLGAIPGDERSTLIVAVVRFKGILRTAGETQIIMTLPEE